MLEQLKSRLQVTYTKEDAKELEEMEKVFHFERFTSQDALKLGTQIVMEAKKYGRDLIVRIIRMEDQLAMFQYVGEEKSQRNIDFAMKKAKTVELTRHCSLWALVQAFGGGNIPSIFEEDIDFLPVGGAVPILVDGKIVAIIAVSGLHDGMDHMVILEAICKIKSCEIPDFHGKYV